jgi:hypothetical protein
VQLTLDSGEVSRGFMTRLGTNSATISSDPVPPAGSRITVRFRRPTNNQEIDVAGEVGEMLSEGGLWRGREAMLVRFDEALGGVLPEDKGAQMREEMHQRERRGAEPSRMQHKAGPGLGGALHASGRGRKRKPQPSLVSESLLETMEAPPVQVPATGPNIPVVDVPRPPAGRASPPDLREQLRVGRRVADSGEVPPVAEDSSPAPSQQPDDTDFFGRFSVDTGEHGVPPIFGEDERGAGADLGLRTVEDMLSTSTQPGIDSNLPLIRRALDAGHRPPGSREAKPPGPPPAEDTPPWERAGEDHARSFIPRHVRIASSLEVTYWSRGRKHEATAQNFSREGAFLAYGGDPPIRGAIVRVEFPIDWSGQNLPVRFNAEVRWHRADRPGSNVPEGFGVQILTFESPKDQGRYDEMLALLLDLENPGTGASEAGYRWGAPNRS